MLLVDWLKPLRPHRSFRWTRPSRRHRRPSQLPPRGEVPEERWMLGTIVPFELIAAGALASLLDGQVDPAEELLSLETGTAATPVGGGQQHVALADQRPAV